MSVVPTRVRFKLQAYMADNDAGARMFTRIRLRLVNAHHLSRRQANPRAPQSTYIWTLGDGSVISLPGLDERDSAKVFAIALSVQSGRILHSPVILNTVATLEPDRSGLAGNILFKHTSAPRILDECSFVHAATALKGVWQMQGSQGKAMRAAVNAYWDALHSVGTRPRFLSLFAAFELAVNAVGTEWSGARFDRKAARLVVVEPTDIKPLRELNNQLKHARALRSHEGEPTVVGRESRALKRLADRSLAARLDFALSGAYSP